MAEKDFDIVLFYSLKAGNDDALELLFNKYYSQLCIYAHSFLNDNNLSEDIITDLFADLWVKRKKIEIKQNFSAYIYKSAKNAALSYIRKKKLETVSFEEVENFDIASSQSTFSKYDKEQSDLKIQTIIKNIPPRSREVFVLHRFDGMKYKEISKLLSISVKTVENHMSTALKVLHKNKEVFKRILTMFLMFLWVRLN